MKVRITGSHRYGDRDVLAGELLEIPDHDARRKIRQGFAVAVTEDEPSAPPIPPAAPGAPAPAPAADAAGEDAGAPRAGPGRNRS